MKDCCITALTEMQEVNELGSCLMFVLKASPYIILIPSLGAGVINQGALQTAAKQLVSMTAKAAWDKSKGANKLPGVSEAVKSAGRIIQLKLSGMAGYHSTKHTGLEYGFWSAFQTLYAEQGGGEPAPDTGWFSGLW